MVQENQFPTLQNWGCHKWSSDFGDFKSMLKLHWSLMHIPKRSSWKSMVVLGFKLK